MAAAGDCGRGSVGVASIEKSTVTASTVTTVTSTVTRGTSAATAPTVTRGTCATLCPQSSPKALSLAGTNARAASTRWWPVSRSSQTAPKGAPSIRGSYKSCVIVYKSCVIVYKSCVNLAQCVSGAASASGCRTGSRRRPSTSLPTIHDQRLSHRQASLPAGGCRGVGCLYRWLTLSGGRLSVPLADTVGGSAVCAAG